MATLHGRKAVACSHTLDPKSTQERGPVSLPWKAWLEPVIWGLWRTYPSSTSSTLRLRPTPVLTAEAAQQDDEIAQAED